MPKEVTRFVSRPKPYHNQKFSFERILEAAKQEATGAKTSSYIATTAAVGILYTTISLIFIAIFPEELLIPLWLLLSFIFAIAFSPIRYALEEFIRQMFPETDYNSHQLIKKLNTISYSSLTLHNFSGTFFTELESGLEITELAFVFFKPNAGYVIKTNSHFKNLQNLSKTEINTLIEAIGHHTNIIHKLPNDDANHILKTFSIKLLVPLTNNNNLVGILLLGDKFNQRPYTTKDVKVLNAVAPKIGFAVKNAYQYEQVFKKNTTLIHELKSTNDQLRRANSQLRHDDKLKDEFVYVATHELKNPVTAMKGYLSLIQEGSYGEIPNKLKKAVNQIESSNQQLINLLNNLLQIARAEAQTLEIKTQPVTICDVIEKVIYDLKPLANQKKLQIDHSCPNPAIKVMADSDRLREILNNLISNAIKYSDQGTVTLTHEIVHDKLHTEVKDQGVGIAKKDQEKIFTRFFRVEEEAAKGIPGSGLGLFIVKQLLEKMGGKISFKSKLGSGSTFTIILPLARTYTVK
jgi:signal transduction histidine kinase